MLYAAISVHMFLDVQQCLSRGAWKISTRLVAPFLRIRALHIFQFRGALSTIFAQEKYHPPLGVAPGRGGKLCGSCLQVIPIGGGFNYFLSIDLPVELTYLPTVGIF